MNFSASIAALAGTASTCFLAYLWYCHEAEKRRLSHEERLRAIDRGESPTDAETEQARVTAGGLIAVFVPLFALAAGVGATALILFHAGGSFLLLGVVWLAATSVGVSGVWGGVSLVRRPGERGRGDARPDDPNGDPETGFIASEKRS